MAFVVDASLAAAWFLPDEASRGDTALARRADRSHAQVPACSFMKCAIFSCLRSKEAASRKTLPLTLLAYLDKMPLRDHGVGDSRANRPTGDQTRVDGLMTPPIWLWRSPRICLWRRWIKNLRRPPARKMSHYSAPWRPHEKFRRTSPRKTGARSSSTRWPPSCRSTAATRSAFC